MSWNASKSPESLLEDCFDAAQADLPSGSQFSRLERKLVAAGVLTAKGTAAATITSIASSPAGSAASFTKLLWPFVALSVGGGAYLVIDSSGENMQRISVQNAPPIATAAASSSGQPSARPEAPGVASPTQVERSNPATSPSRRTEFTPASPASPASLGREHVPQATKPSVGHTPQESTESSAKPVATSVLQPAEAGEKQAQSERLDELRLLQEARRVVASNPSRALRLIHKHRSEYPKTRMIQERELIAIEAWVRSGQAARAQRAAQRFEERFPRSALLPRLKTLLGN